MMLLWVVTLCVVALTVNGKDHNCRGFTNDVCSKNDKPTGIDNCNSEYSEVHQVKSDIQQFTATHIDHNWHYLLMSANFGNFKANRAGFSKLFRKLADDTWEDTMDLIKYMAKRGFNMRFDIPLPTKKVSIVSHVMNEFESISTALDMQKTIAEAAHALHRTLTGHKKYHDAETINFIEKEFVNKHSETIRNLAGHANDLHLLIKGNATTSTTPYDPSIAIYMFDEYLQKIVS